MPKSLVLFLLFVVVSTFWFLTSEPGKVKDAVTSDFKSESLGWGRPSPISDNKGKVFRVTSSNGLEGSLKFPVTIGRNDGSVTYDLRFEFEPMHLRLTSHCVYRDQTQGVVAELNAPLDAVGDRVANGYAISKPQQAKTEQQEKQCSTEITTGKYLLMRDDNSFRLYVDPDNFFELDPN